MRQVQTQEFKTQKQFETVFSKLQDKWQSVSSCDPSSQNSFHSERRGNWRHCASFQCAAEDRSSWQSLRRSVGRSRGKGGCQRGSGDESTRIFDENCTTSRRKTDLEMSSLGESLATVRKMTKMALLAIANHSRDTMGTSTRLYGFPPWTSSWLRRHHRHLFIGQEEKELSVGDRDKPSRHCSVRSCWLRRTRLWRG